MKRSRIALAAVVALSSMLVGGSPAAADELRDGVVMTGQGAAVGVPDTLVADFGAETVAPTVGKALEGTAAAAAKMRAALFRAGIAKADLRTPNAEVSAQRGDEGRITGYLASQGLSATIRNLSKAGSVMTATIAAGGDAARLNGMAYAVENDSALLAEARKKAFADAKQKAELYAGQAGRQLGQVVRISETAPRFGEPSSMDQAAMRFTPITVEPGQQRLTATVTVEWTFTAAGNGRPARR